MPRQTIEFRIVVASPTDVLDERNAVFDVLSELDRTVEAQNISIRAIGWEEYASPGVASGADSQALVTRQILNEFDILIALFGVRLGIPAATGRTGTMEEIERSIAEKDSPFGDYRVQIYFQNRIGDLSKVNTDELVAVANYRKDLASRGVLYRNFHDVAELAREVRVNVNRAIQNFSQAKSTQIRQVDSTPAGKAIRSPEIIAAQPIEVGGGLLDLMEKAETSFISSTNSMEQMGRLVEEIGAETRKQTDLIQELLQSDIPAAIKKQTINKFADFLKERAIAIKSLADESRMNFRLAMDAAASVFELGMTDGNRDNYVEGRAKFREQAKTFLQTIRGTRNEVMAFGNSVKTVPRITIQFN